MFPNSQHFAGKKGSKMGTMTSDKWVNYSYGHAQTKQQVG
jgi:hypothetical protein